MFNKQIDLKKYDPELWISMHKEKKRQEKRKEYAKFA